MSHPSMKMLTNKLNQFPFSREFVPVCVMNNKRRSHNVNPMIHVCVDYLGDSSFR